jgi:hypothetical protein
MRDEYSASLLNIMFASAPLTNSGSPWALIRTGLKVTDVIRFHARLLVEGDGIDVETAASPDRRDPGPTGPRGEPGRERAGQAEYCHACISQ